MYKRAEFKSLLMRMQHGGPLSEAQADNVCDEVDRLVRAERHAFASHVAATADEFGEDMEGSIERLAGLLAAEARGDDPSTFSLYHAPEEG